MSKRKLCTHCVTFRDKPNYALPGKARCDKCARLWDAPKRCRCCGLWMRRKPEINVYDYRGRLVYESKRLYVARDGNTNYCMLCRRLARIEASPEAKGMVHLLTRQWATFQAPGRQVGK